MVGRQARDLEVRVRVPVLVQIFLLKYESFCVSTILCKFYSVEGEGKYGAQSKRQWTKKRMTESLSSKHFTYVRITERLIY